MFSTADIGCATEVLCSNWLVVYGFLFVNFVYDFHNYK